MEEADNVSNDLATDPTKRDAINEAQESFRADLNHKLRTPLNAIIGFAELLALQPGSKQKEGDVQQILKSAREMLDIIEQELADLNAATRERTDVAALTGRLCDVLYVEDDEANFTLVERILEYRPGIQLTHACDGQRGLRMAKGCQPRMILLDLNLPDIHGSEVLRQLQENQATAQIPVVILSADASASQIERLLAAGAKNYLTKPFYIDHFLAVIDEFLSTSRA